MDANGLWSAVVAFGADEAGIRDRFGGNAELYARCFQDFLVDPNASALQDALQGGAYDRAFDAAHALKGISGNLGLTAYYRAISALVASLRAKQYEQAKAEYAEVCAQFDLLRRVAAGEQPPPRAPETTEHPAPKASGEVKKRELFVPLAVGIVLLTILLVFLLFQNITTGYERSVTTESAGHLVEINYQLKEYIEDQMESDWLIAYTIRSYIAHSPEYGGDAALLGVMRDLRALWNVSDIILYAENGYAASAEGTVQANDLASEMTSEASLRGEYLKIVKSDITYTVPVETTLTLNGSPIVAVSVVKSMDSFLDEMQFSSFDESAFVYLCNDLGAVVSSLSVEGATPAFNIISLLRTGKLTTTAHRPISPEEAMAAAVPTTYLHDDNYFVYTPIVTRSGVFGLAYFVPENIVNRTMSEFSGSITRSSLLVIAVFAVIAVLTVAYVNSLRKRQLNKALLTREHMFDLLVKGSQTGFGLFELNKPRPSFLSSNALAVTGVDKPALYKTEAGFELRSGVTPELPSFAQINETLRTWDGRGVYRSGFIENSEAMPPVYFELQFMAAGEDSDEYVGVAQDVTQLYEREAIIKNSLAMAEQASDAKSRFLSNMFHDIRTPMNAIVNMADFAMEDMANPAKLSEDLKTIRESSDHLLGLINDILDMSRIESGKTTIDRAPFDIAAELKRLQNIIAPLCAEKNLTLITDFTSVQTPLLLGDQVKVSQILMNLLSNAVKFTPKNGAIRFLAKQSPSIREHYVDMRFTVEDTGMGVAPAFLPHIFEPFTRGDEKRVSGIQGTGLGLSISHSYVLAMGGQIRCESVEGDGATFTVDLFFEKAEVAAAPAPESTAWEVTPFIGLRCLFCEDNRTNQRIGKAILERLGFKVDLANDGLEGLTAFKKSSPGYYDVLYLDIQMPVMDGYEAAAAIRECAHPQARTIPIIAVSANVFIEDVEKARIAGMDGHVGKPINTAALANETRAVLSKRRGEQA